MHNRPCMVDLHLLTQCMFTPSDFYLCHCTLYASDIHVHGTCVLASSISLHVHVHAVFMFRIFVHSRLL